MNLKDYLTPREKRNLAWMSILAAMEYDKRWIKRGRVKLKAKKLAVLIPIPKEYLRECDVGNAKN